MTDARVWVFFYGSYMNPDVLREVEIVPVEWEVARLSGFDVEIRPRANLVRSEQHAVYGVLTTATHAQLARLYAHAKDVLGETYLPFPVSVETLDGKSRLALCYIAPVMEAKPADRAYVERILQPAREFGLPRWYVERLERSIG
ncbi:MAG TPA: gamma-glutamylcyclotransferase family protein [Polyangiaceae bacterium]|nr:gamma-glutamylcyclotransferase family protein [Polyangiaceae bacterium]